MHVNALYAAKPQPFGPRGAPSSIIKQPVLQLTVELNGTVEDEQGNKKLHGGPEKVLHQYNPDAYAIIHQHRPELANSAVPGSIGENISVVGMQDDNVYVGDIYQFGDVVLQVSAPRAPCNKISHRYNAKNMDLLVGRLGITGWYYRVLATGTIKVNDSVTLVERPKHSVSISDLMRCVVGDASTQNIADAKRFSTLSVLDDEWRGKCLRIVNKSQ